jgi:hypothetical protein
VALAGPWGGNHHRSIDRLSPTRTVLIDSSARASPWGKLTLRKSTVDGRPGRWANLYASPIHAVFGRDRFRNTTKGKTTKDGRHGTYAECKKPAETGNNDKSQQERAGYIYRHRETCTEKYPDGCGIASTARNWGLSRKAGITQCSESTEAPHFSKSGSSMVCDVGLVAACRYGVLQLEIPTLLHVQTDQCRLLPRDGNRLRNPLELEEYI